MCHVKVDNSVEKNEYLSKLLPHAMKTPFRKQNTIVEERVMSWISFLLVKFYVFYKPQVVLNCIFIYVAMKIKPLTSITKVTLTLNIKPLKNSL